MEMRRLLFSAPQSLTDADIPVLAPPVMSLIKYHAVVFNFSPGFVHSHAIIRPRSRS